MDRKTILILVACFGLMLLWPSMVDRIYPPPKKAPRLTNLVTQAELANTTLPTNQPGDTNRPASVPVITAPASPAAAWVRPAEPEQLLTLDTDDARYTFTSYGGGLKTIELKEYHASVACGRSGTSTNAAPLVKLNDGAPVPALALFGGAALQDSVPFKLSRTDRGLRAEKTLTNGLRLMKDFVPGTNYLIAADIRVENDGTNTLALAPQELVIGTATPINRRDNGQLLGMQWYDGQRAQFISEPWFANRTLGCFPGTPRSEYRNPGESNVVWAAAHNQFFVMIAAAQTNAAQVVARRIDLPPPSTEEIAEDRRVVARPFGFQTAFLYPAASVAPGQSLEWKLDVFAGPKEYNTLAKLSVNQDLAMQFGWGIFGWFARALLLGMNALHKLGLPYALCIIGITVVIKLLFWPLTQASTRSMKRMQALQPQMKEIQTKYKDDPKKMNQKLMEFMKEHKVSPLGGCLPMLLQIPVFIGFYQMLRSAIELRGAHFLWACDLSQPDTVAVLFGFPINPLPLIMGATQFWQARLTPASPGADPVQQKMMQYMPLLFIFILYNFSAGLALYWTVQNLLSILQNKLIRNLGDPLAAHAAPARPTAQPPGGSPRKK